MVVNNWMSLGMFEILYFVLGKVLKMDILFNISSFKIMIIVFLGELYEILKYLCIGVLVMKYIYF